MKTRQQDWYDTPQYYDIIFDQDTSAEADFLEKAARAYLGYQAKGGLRILEPACGSGRLLLELARRGHRVAGFDLNPSMLASARDRFAAGNGKARLWQDKLEDFHVPPSSRFDLAVCLVSTFKYIPSESGAVSHLKCVADCLCPGGIYVLGFHLTDYSSTRRQRERWVGQRDGITVVCNTQTWPADRKTRTERIRTRLKITRQGESWVQETPWVFRSYNPAQVQALLAKVPELECIACHDFHYDLEKRTSLRESHFDLVLVLRKR